jgi:hypothetical protein
VAGLTVCANGLDGEPLKFESPEYVATIECGPAAPNATEHVATPVEVFTTTDPQPGITTLLSVNETVPPSGTGETVAVNVTI